MKNIALVTGASSGIGKALTIELLKKKYEVIALARSETKLELLKKECSNDHLRTISCDVTDQKALEKAFLSLQSQNRIPKLFFLNAGLAGFSAVEPRDYLDIAFHKNMFEINYFGVLNVVKFWLSPCIRNGGATFALTSSINAFFAPPGGSSYAASKAAISKAFDGLRLTHLDDNLKFTNIYCGPVDTAGLAGKLPFTWPAKHMARYMIAMARAGKAHAHPSIFYRFLSLTLNVLPARLALKILEKLSRENN